jgi:hypothetical protein
MAHLTISVPPQHVDALRDSVLHAYTATAEALHEAVNRQLDTGEAVDDVLGLRIELNDLDDLLEQLGLARGAPCGALELIAHPEVLSDAAHGALDDAIEQVRAISTAYWRGDGSAADARAALATAGERLDLLAAIQDGRPE